MTLTRTAWLRNALLAATALLTWTSSGQAQTSTDADSTDWTARIAALPCAAFTPAGRFRDTFSFEQPQPPSKPVGTAPFGVPYLEWTQPRFNALKARVRSCGNPNVNGTTSSSESEHAMFYVQLAEMRTIPAVTSARADRERKMAQNARVQADIDQASKLPPKEQIVALQRILGVTYDAGQRDQINAQIERSQDLAAVQDDANKSAANADTAQQRIAEAQRIIEQNRRDHDTAQAAIARERAAIEEQRRNTQIARQQAADAQARADKLRQQEAALAPAQREAEDQRRRDEAELQQLRQQRIEADQQRDQAADDQADAQADEQEKKLDAMAVTLARRNDSKLDGIGFPADLLDATIMVPNGSPDRFQPFVKLGQLLGVYLAKPELSIAPASGFGGTHQGFTIKRPGAPTDIMLFRNDGGELYLNDYGVGDTAKPVSGDDLISANLLLILTYRAVLMDVMPPG